MGIYKETIKIELFMKKNKKTVRNLTLSVIVLIAATCYWGCSNDKFDPNANIPLDEKGDTEMASLISLKELPWNYPIKPGTKEWGLLKTEDERIAALQIPEAILAKLTPEETVGLCINLPAFGLYLAFDTPQEGFSVMLSRYNIIKHLMSCKDAGSSLLSAYKDTDLKGFESYSYSNEYWSIKLYYIELLLSQEEILQSLSSEESLELLTKARQTFSEKLDNEDFASFNGTLFTVRIMASVLDKEEYPQITASGSRTSVTRFAKEGTLDDKALVDEIISATDNYITSKTKL